MCHEGFKVNNVSMHHCHSTINVNVNVMNIDRYNRHISTKMNIDRYNRHIFQQK